MAERILTVTDGAHSPLGPSSSKRWIECPASVLATQHLPNVSSEFAIEGTAAHGVAEECDKLGVRADHFLGWTVRVARDGGHTDVECVQEMVDGVNAFLDYVDDLPGESLCETQVSYGQWVPDGFGTLDRAKVEDHTVHLIDFKYGKGVQVYAEDNSQLKLYALGFIETFGWMYPEVEAFVLHIVQPRLDHADRWTISRSDLLQWADDIVMPAALKTSNPKAPYKAGDWCQFCKVRATCMVRASAVFETVIGDFEDLDAAAAAAPQPVGSLTNEQVAKILANLPNVERWCKDIKAHALSELAAARPVGGYKIVEGRSNREWSNEVEAAEALVKAGVKKADLYTYKLLTVPAAEALVGKKHELFKTHVRKPPGKPTLAPPTDKRPPLTIDPSTEFSNLDAE